MKSKKILIGIVVVVVLFIIGLIGKNNNEAKMVIKNAEIAINEGNYEKARELLYTVVDGNNKKIDKLWNIVNSYQNAQTANLEAGLKYLDEIDNSYKKYNKLKEKIITLKQEDINGKMKTRFYPFISDKGMCFNQRWIYIIGLM